MAQPKRKTSKSKKQMRIRSHTRTYPETSVCQECGSPVLPHRVCHSCGNYKGRQVLTVSIDD
ncbi:MAG: large subunit ribosomal protein L32 [Kiritimatiellia bacterium]|jgi:large subunit ribosomal protein L32